jgi:hypothetical protein
MSQKGTFLRNPLVIKCVAGPDRIPARQFTMSQAGKAKSNLVFHILVQILITVEETPIL